MKRRMFASLAVLFAGINANAQPAPPDLLAKFDSQLSIKDQTDWLKLLYSEPNQVGSPHDKIIADWVVSQFKKFGWDTRVETFQVLYPTPVSESVEMGDFKATLTEKPIPGDSTSNFKDYELPAYLAYQGDGDVTAPLVYVNYGTEADYKELARRASRSRARSSSPAMAKGGAGSSQSSPPGTAPSAASSIPIPPMTDMRRATSIRKGRCARRRAFSAAPRMDMTLYPGDPLTPGIPATQNAKRLTRETAPSVLKIPALPISYADAQVLLSAMDGRLRRELARRAPITYHIGPGTKAVHLAVKSNWD